MANVDILALAKEAQNAKIKNPKVIDATIGMFYNDKKELIIPQVSEAFRNVDITKAFPYGTPTGGPLFESNLLSWVFDQTLEEVKKDFYLKALATPGGSGALSVFFGTYGKPGDEVLISDIRWRYDFFTDAAHLKIRSFELFEEESFNLRSFKEQLDTITAKQRRVMVVINDPCHNPTGYQLSSDEWKSIIAILNTYTNNELYLIYDLAYFDFDPRGLKQSRETFLILKALKEHVNVLVAFSASKSLAIYGMRLGGAIGMFKKKEDCDSFSKRAANNALGKWSTAPSVGIEVFNSISEKEQKEEFLVYANQLRVTLKERGDVFISDAKKFKLSHYPYRGGFFILVKSNNPIADVEKLITRFDVYAIPMEEGIRIALCSLTNTEVKGLAEKISQVVNA